MARDTNTYFDRITLDDISDTSGSYNPVPISPGNKFSIRFPDNSVFGHDGPCTDTKMTITLKIEEGS